MVTSFRDDFTTTPSAEWKVSNGAWTIPTSGTGRLTAAAAGLVIAWVPIARSTDVLVDVGYVNASAGATLTRSWARFNGNPSSAAGYASGFVSGISNIVRYDSGTPTTLLSSKAACNVFRCSGTLLGYGTSSGMPTAQAVTDSTYTAAGHVAVSFTAAAAGDYLEIDYFEAKPLPALDVSAPLITNLMNGKSSTDATSYTTASISPVAKRALVLSVSSVVGSGTANAPTVTGLSITWTQRATQTQGTRRVTIFTAESGASAPTPGALTIDFAGQTQTGAAWSVETVAMYDSSAVYVQSATASGSSSALTATLANVPKPYSAVIGAVCQVNANTWTSTSPLSELTDFTDTAPARSHSTAAGAVAIYPVYGAAFAMTASGNGAEAMVCVEIGGSGPTTGALGIALDTDDSMALHGVKSKLLGTAYESESGIHLIGPGNFTLLVSGKENESALPLHGGKRHTLGVAVESSAAVALHGVKSKVMGLAVESSSATALHGVKSRLAGLARENASALAMAGVKRALLHLARESESALHLTSPLVFVIMPSTTSVAVDSPRALAMIDAYASSVRVDSPRTLVLVD